MSSSPYNTQNINNYLDLQGLVTDSSFAAADGSNFSSSTYSTNLAAGRANIDGQSTWNLGAIDFASNPPPQLTYNATVPSDSSYVVAYGNGGPGATFTPYYFALPVSQVLRGQTLSSIEDFYNTYYTQYASQWEDFTSNFWSNGPPQAGLMEQVWLSLETNVNQQYTTISSVAPFPTSFQGFLNVLSQLQVFTNSNPLSSYSLNQQNTAYPPSNELTSFFKITSPQPVTQATTQQVQDSLWQSFISTYPVSSSAPITPQSFAAAWQTFISKPFVGNIPTATIDISISTLGSSSAPVVIPYKTVAVPFTSGAQITTSTAAANFGQTFYNTLLNDYTTALQTTTDTTNLQNFSATTDFLNTFNFFVRQVVSGAVPATSVDDFFNKYTQFVGPSVLLGASGIVTYQQIYNAFFPPGTTIPLNDNYVTLLNSFVSQFTNSSSGVFNSSLMSDQWFNTVASAYYATQGISEGQQPLLQSDFNETKILFAIYDLLISLLTEFQKMTAAQAAREIFLTKYENAYTSLIASIPGSFVLDGIPGDSRDNTADIQINDSHSGDIAAANQRWTTSLTGYSSAVSDIEKNQETLVNQSFEASNQNTNLIGSILQELQSLLQSIWR